MKIDESRGNKYPFFPKYDLFISVAGTAKVVQLTTTIRKRNRNGAWFFWDVTRTYSDTLHDNLENVATRWFIEDCYKVLIIGIIDQNLIDDNGRPIFKRDPNQESETERLSRLANGK